MTLTASSKQLVSESLARIQPHATEVVTLAYRFAFQTFPELEARFQTVMGGVPQSASRPSIWMTTFVQCVSTADGGAELLFKLGQMHAAYHSRPEQVEGMLSAFVDAVARFDGEHWSEPLARAWREFMAHVGFHVNQGLRQAA